MNNLPRGSTVGAYPYKLLRPLGQGEGGMSHIYLATMGDIEQPREEDLVAVKIANIGSQHSQFHVSALDNEIEHLRKLRHPGIVRLYRIQGQTLPPNPIFSAQSNLPGRPWFSVMEYLSGGSLADLLKREKRLEPGLALQIVHELALALAHIHKHEMVHLDIKPENVVFRQPIRPGAIDPVFVDFGIARGLGQVGLEASTLQYSPPERIIHSESKNLPPETMSKPHPSMDIYSLGLVLYKMVAGRLPFEGSRQSVTSAILQGNPTEPSRYEPAIKTELDRLIISAIHKDPAQRPTALEFVERVEKLLKDPQYQAVTIPKGPEPKKLSSPSPWKRFVLPIGGVVMLGLVAFTLLQGQSAPGLFVEASSTPTVTEERIVVPPSATRTRRAATATRTTVARATSTRSSAAPAAVKTSTPVATFTLVPPTNTPLPPTRVPPTRTFAPPTWTSTPRPP